MVKQHDDITTRPLPSTTTPWVVILCLLAAIVLMYLGFLRPKDRLLGMPLHRNEYQQYLAPPKTLPAPAPVPAAPTPPVSHHAGSSATSTPLAPAAAPAESPLDSQRVIGE